MEFIYNPAYLFTAYICNFLIALYMAGNEESNDDFPYALFLLFSPMTFGLIALVTISCIPLFIFEFSKVVFERRS